MKLKFIGKPLKKIGFICHLLSFYHQHPESDSI
jgi:hypothetical protein